MSPDTIPTYDQYFEYLMYHVKQLEAAITDNTTSRKANIAESDYMQPYSSSDEYYDDTAKLLTFMVDRGGDVNMINDVLQCNKAMKQGKTVPPLRTHQFVACLKLVVDSYRLAILLQPQLELL